MNVLPDIISFFLHIDQHLTAILQQYGTLTYAIVFGIIFVETGVVIMPLLPGDSLLFALGALSARGSLDLFISLGLMYTAAIVGDTVNYSIGRAIGPRVFQANGRFLKKKYLDKTHAFYDRYGAKTIIVARFVPIVRTFAPFVAGVGQMPYRKFLSYNIIGGLLWVTVFIFSGYFFGTIPIVEKNFSLVTFGIIGVSLVPAIIEILKEKFGKKPVTEKVEE